MSVPERSYSSKSIEAPKAAAGGEHNLTSSSPGLEANVCHVSATAVAPVILLLAILAVGVWVYKDAREHRDGGRTVAVTIGTITIDTPEAWLTVCVVFSIAFIPIYLVARQHG